MGFESNAHDSPEAREASVLRQARTILNAAFFESPEFEQYTASLEFLGHFAVRTENELHVVSDIERCAAIADTVAQSIETVARFHTPMTSPPSGILAMPLEGTTLYIFRQNTSLACYASKEETYKEGTSRNRLLWCTLPAKGCFAVPDAMEYRGVDPDTHEHIDTRVLAKGNTDFTPEVLYHYLRCVRGLTGRIYEAAAAKRLLAG